jgi:dCTP deaminase
LLDEIATGASSLSNIGQLCFCQLSSPSETPYGSAKYLNRYQGQRGPTASRSFMNFHITDVGNEPLEQRD